MNDEYLINRGYNKYKRSAFDPDSVECIFQKCFKDEVGKKYFITVKKWSWKQFRDRLHDYPEITYEYYIQMYSKDDHKTIDITFFKEWTIEEVEDEIERMFSTGRYDYYEEW